MKIDGAIFDLDGTLLDSMYIWNSVMGNYLESLGITPKADLNKTLKPMSLEQAAIFCQKTYHMSQSVPEIMQGINDMTEQAYRYEVQPKAGVPAFLEDLKGRGTSMCIATVTDDYLVEAALKRCGLDRYFSGIITCAQVGYGKTRPDIYYRALEFLHTKKENTLIFEDAVYAVKTAKTAGFITVAMQDKFEPEQAEIARLADYYCRNYDDATKFLLVD